MKKFYRVLDENVNRYFAYTFDNEKNAVRFLQVLNNKKNNPFQTYRVVKFVNNVAVKVNV